MVPKLKWFVLTFGRKPLFLAVVGESFPGLSLCRGAGVEVVVAKSPQFLFDKKTKQICNSFSGHFVLTKKVFLRSFTKIQLSKHNYMTEHSIVYYCSHIFHRILRRSLTIIFSQREGSSHVASIKAPSFQQPILSNCFSILAQEGQESEFECINIKSWRCEKKSLRKMWGKI